MKGLNPRGLSLRLRLTLLYAALLLAVLLSVGVFVHASLRRVMQSEADRSLWSAWQRAVREDLEYVDGSPTFFDPGEDEEADAPPAAEAPEAEAIALRILLPDGTVGSGLGPYEDLPIELPGEEGYSSMRVDDAPWRLYSRPLPHPAEAFATPAASPAGSLPAATVWLQAARSMERMEQTLLGMRRYLLAGFPALLALACAAGFLFASRALRPLAGMARAAAAIGGQDLSLRIGHRGSAPEIAELEASFDRMLDRLEGAFARERRFTADAAHELRTPLTALKGQIEVALGKVRSAEEYRRTLSVLLQYVDRLVALADDLLLIARLELTARERPAERVELGELLESVAEQLEPLVQARRLEVEVRRNGPVAVRGDLGELIRLFLNLLDNAAKYSPEGAAIEVNVSRDGKLARVAVCNRGPGIPEEDLPRVFDRFYRVGGDRSRQSGGAGLGLAIARQIARRHGGDIRARSEPGVRTSFTVELPADAAEE